MDFYLSIPAITQAIKVYLNTYQTLEEREKTRNTTITELAALGWSGSACDAFMEAHEQKMQLYAKLKEDILYMINALQEEKQRALMLKMRCEDFVNCIERTGQGGAITGDDEGILSLDFSSQSKINNYVNNCVDEDYTKLNSNFSKINDILGELEYTSFGIGGEVDTLINSVKDQTESLTEFDDSFNVYYAGVKDMESNICSVFSKISANGYSPFQNSSVLAPNGEIDKNNMVNAALRNQNGFTVETLGANTNITNGMNLENLGYEVDNNIENNSSPKTSSVWDALINAEELQENLDGTTQEGISETASDISKTVSNIGNAFIYSEEMQENTDQMTQQADNELVETLGEDWVKFGDGVSQWQYDHPKIMEALGIGMIAFGGAQMLAESSTAGEDEVMDAEYTKLQEDSQILNNITRTLYGTYGEEVPYVGEYFEGVDEDIIRGFDPPTFYSVANKAGGEVYVSTDAIVQSTFEKIVDNADSDVVVLTGTHGNLDGEFGDAEINFYNDDLSRWSDNKNVEVLDITKMSDEEITKILNSDNKVVCAWCYSERSRTILKALGLIE